MTKDFDTLSLSLSTVAHEVNGDMKTHIFHWCCSVTADGMRENPLLGQVQFTRCLESSVTLQCSSSSRSIRT